MHCNLSKLSVIVIEVVSVVDWEGLTSGETIGFSSI